MTCRRQASGAISPLVWMMPRSAQIAAEEHGQDLAHEGVLRAEPPVEGGRADSGGAGDVLHAGAGPAFGEDPFGRGQQRSPQALVGADQPEDDTGGRRGAEDAEHLRAVPGPALGQPQHRLYVRQPRAEQLHAELVEDTDHPGACSLRANGLGKFIRALFS